MESLNNKLDKLSDLQKEDILREMAVRIERDAKINAPAKSGELRQSITHTVSPEEARIGTNLFYAPYVHQGTGSGAINKDGRQGW